MDLFVFFLLGVLLAGMESILFIRFSDKIIANYIGLFSGISFLVGSWLFTYNSLSLKELKSETLCIYLASFAFFFVVFLYFINKIFIKSTDDKYPVKMIDILRGDVKAFKYYRQNIQKQIAAELKYDELCKLKDLNEEESRKIDEIKAYISQKETNLLQLEETLNENLSNAVCLELPIKYKYPITKNYLNNMEAYIKAFVQFDNYIFNSTEGFLVDQENNKDRDQLDFLKGYFNFLCLSTSKILFGYHEGVRTHIRYSCEGYYKTIACCVGEDKSEKTLTKIPLKKGMIFKSNESKQSLIKSCNLTHHFPARNDHIWKDYITIPIIDIENDNENVPLLSIGISIKYPGIHSDILKFLNFIKIETVYSKNICKINESYDIINLLCKGGV